jgi:hypothetical protein
MRIREAIHKAASYAANPSTAQNIAAGPERFPGSARRPCEELLVLEPVKSVSTRFADRFFASPQSQAEALLVAAYAEPIFIKCSRRHAAAGATKLARSCRRRS